MDNSKDIQQTLKPDAVYHFGLDGEPASVVPHGEGHINTTYLVTTTTGHRYILQRISDAFDISALMKNMEAVTRHLAKKVKDSREALALVSTTSGESYYTDETGSYRIFEFVEDTICLQLPDSIEDVYNCAVGFGRFQGQLADFPVEVLTEPIPNFHNTVDRYRIFHGILEKDPLGRASKVKEEIAFALEREEEAGCLQHMRETGELPTRVTHNDTKLNNVLLDKDTRKALCVVDLDTVMPGLSLYDFGDLIRSGAGTAMEDEQDVSKMTIHLDKFRAFAKGFMETCPLTETEVKYLCMGAKIMTLECGVRFLTDYIDGDHYFAIHRPGHNLDRCRTQFRLVAQMEEHWDEMQDIVEEISKKLCSCLH